MSFYQIPPYLKPGDRIGITAPAGYVSAQRVSHCLKVLADWGFETLVDDSIGRGSHYFSGTDEERMSSLQNMLNDDSLAAILMGRGGYGLSRIIDQLDFSFFQEKPKWLCGFSDITVLHQHVLSRHGTAVMHSAMCGAFTPASDGSDHLIQFKNLLQGESLQLSFSSVFQNIAGESEGTLTGGNLAILDHLVGSRSLDNASGKIVFIEDVGEHLYQVDRMMYTLVRSGYFDRVVGIVVGSFTEMEDTERPFGQSLEEILIHHLKPLHVPVAFGLPAGHQPINYALKLGLPYRLSVQESSAQLLEMIWV